MASSSSPSGSVPVRPPSPSHSPPAALLALTCALLNVAAFLQRMSTQLAMEVFLPELSEPDVSPVIVQRPAGEIAIKTCQGSRRWECEISEIIRGTSRSKTEDRGKGVSHVHGRRNT